MPHFDRVRRLLEMQGSHPVERALLEGEVLAYEPHQNGSGGREQHVLRRDRARSGRLPQASRGHGAPRRAQLRAFSGHAASRECAAWQLAKRLGEPYDRLVAVTVYRAVGPSEDEPDSWHDGSLALKHEGAAMKGAAVTRDVPDDALAAAPTASSPSKATLCASGPHAVRRDSLSRSRGCSKRWICSPLARTAQALTGTFYASGKARASDDAMRATSASVSDPGRRAILATWRGPSTAMP